MVAVISAGDSVGQAEEEGATTPNQQYNENETHLSDGLGQGVCLRCHIYKSIYLYLEISLGGFPS